VIRRLARIEVVSFAGDAPAMSAQMVLGGVTFCMPLGTLIDLDAEKARLGRELDKVLQDIARIMQKLGNEKFVANARPDVVEAERERLEICNMLKDKTEKALARLDAG
jgi:valyl-tRNA synthetase